MSEVQFSLFLLLLLGLCASVSLFPFDFVRAGVVSGNQRPPFYLWACKIKPFHLKVISNFENLVSLDLIAGPKRFLAAGSTVPYAGALFGVYFANR